MISAVRRPGTGRRIVTAARLLTTPLLPEDYLGLVNPLWSATDLRGRVEAVRHEAPATATLVIKPGRTWQGHRPGQWIRIGVDIGGVLHWRTFSLSSPPRRDGRITITVKAARDGFVSAHLVNEIRPGTIIRLAPAEGDFTLPEPVPEKLLFITAGSGITPVMAMLRHLAGTANTSNADAADRHAVGGNTTSGDAAGGSTAGGDAAGGSTAGGDAAGGNTAGGGAAGGRTIGGGTPDVVVVHSDRTPNDVIFGAALRRVTGVRLHERHTSADGRFKPSTLPDICPDWAEREAWACGPGEMLDDLTAFWRAAGVEERLRVERFRAVLQGGGEGGRVTFTRSGVDVDADGSTPLLVAGEDAGALLPSGCRMGICYGCVGRLCSGQVRDLRTGRVHGEEGEIVQTCISAAAGPVEIEL